MSMTDAKRLISRKVGEFSIKDAFLIGASKSVTETLVAPVLGNGNLMSGLSKMGGALGLGYVSNKRWSRIVATGLAVDAVEDILAAAMARLGRN